VPASDALGICLDVHPTVAAHDSPRCSADGSPCALDLASTRYAALTARRHQTPWVICWRTDNACIDQALRSSAPCARRSVAGSRSNVYILRCRHFLYELGSGAHQLHLFSRVGVREAWRVEGGARDHPPRRHTLFAEGWNNRSLPESSTSADDRSASAKEDDPLGSKAFAYDYNPYGRFFAGLIFEYPIIRSIILAAIVRCSRHSPARAAEIRATAAIGTAVQRRPINRDREIRRLTNRRCRRRPNRPRNRLRLNAKCVRQLTYGKSGPP